MNEELTNDEVEIDLVDLGYVLLDKWRYLLISLIAGAVLCELPEIFRLKFAPQPQLWCILVYSVVSLSVSSTFRKSIISS